MTSGPDTRVRGLAGLRIRPRVRASKLLPHPGGPWRRRPRTGRTPRSSRREGGAASGIQTRRRICRRTSSSPPTPRVAPVNADPAPALAINSAGRASSRDEREAVGGGGGGGAFSRLLYAGRLFGLPRLLAAKSASFPNFWSFSNCLDPFQFSEFVAANSSQSDRFFASSARSRTSASVGRESMRTGPPPFGVSWTPPSDRSFSPFTTRRGAPRAAASFAVPAATFAPPSERRAPTSGLRTSTASRSKPARATMRRARCEHGSGPSPAAMDSSSNPSDDSTSRTRLRMRSSVSDPPRTIHESHSSSRLVRSSFKYTRERARAASFGARTSPSEEVAEDTRG
mmetsp:Transcript_47563/g.92849  ORF Transcript_47563/g.92849 Transcript_47563/m.92849 type:complete len:341 (-) Transcript_47563:298-1320(-)